MKDPKELVDQALEVQELLLDDFLRILKDHECSPTDRATIARYLSTNNFRVDPAAVPKKLQDLAAEMRSARGNKPREFPDPSVIPDVYPVRN